jgi:hypothetical protein
MIRVYGGQPVEMGNAGAFQAQSPLYTTPLAPVWGGGPLVPGDVPGREYFRGPEPTQKYKMGSSEMPLGNVGGLLEQGSGVNGQSIAQGIPVGQDPRFPMDQEMFGAYVDEQRFKSRYPNPGDFRRYVEQFNKSYFPAKQVTLPGDIGGKYVS